MSIIKHINAKEIKDSRGKPTLRVSVVTDDGNSGVFDVPSGVSTGSNEALELRDEDGGVSSAIDMAENAISKQLIGMDILNQKTIDEVLITLDGTSNKKVIGSNTSIGVSIAVLKAASQSQGVEPFEYMREQIGITPSRVAPYLFVNLVEGGKHAEDGSPFQEHMIIPETDSVERAYQMATVIKSALEELLLDTFKKVDIENGDEGGFVFSVDSIEESFEFLKDAIYRAGHDEPVHIGADVAASSFYVDGKYDLINETVTKEEFLDLYKKLITDYSIWSLEDPFFEGDQESFRALKNYAKDTLIIGDDLTVTNEKCIRESIKEDSIGAVIIKPNQIGTMTETFTAMKFARDAGLHLIVSHRGGETMDDFIADLAYAFGCFGLKAGAIGSPVRDAKYKRLIDISNR